jgi:hypothetical protein
MPLFQILESIFFVFLMVAWIWVVVGVISDVFASDDLRGASKGIWVLFVIIIPWLGILAYLVARGEGMRDRRAKAISDVEEAQRAYIKSVAGPSTVDELAKLADLKDKGKISQAEFDAYKAKLLR